MAKKRNKSKKQQIRPPHKQLPDKAMDELNQAEWLIRRKQWPQALEALQALDRRQPTQPEILHNLIRVCLELNDMRLYLHYLHRLQELRPKNPELHHQLAGAYAVNMFPALAVDTYRKFSDQHPDSPLANDVTEALDRLEPVLKNLLADLAVGDADAYAVAVENDKMRIALDTGKFRRARSLAANILKQAPNMLPVLNNLSLVEFLEGNLDKAVEQAEQVLALDAANFQAWSNLIKCLYLQGQTDTATEKATQFKSIESTDVDIWLKKAETFTYLGDDQAVQETLKSAEKAGIIDEITSPALLYHFAAVAEMRLGNEAQARQYWQQALNYDPNLNSARENLADLEKPIGERHAPWPFPGNQWISASTAKEVGKLMDAFTKRKSQKALQKSANRLLTQHPELETVLPILLERGDPWGRDFAASFINITELPTLVAKLPEFIFSKHGPDSIRHQAAITAQQADLLPSKEVRLWLNGTWQEIMLLGFEIHYEHDDEFDSLGLAKLMDTFSQALDQRNYAKAEESLRAVLEIKPDNPSILNNLAAVLGQQGKRDEAQQLLNRIRTEFPDYFFGIISTASQHIIDKKFEAARNLLKPLLMRDRLHISEFNALARVHIQLYLAEDQLAGAQTWLEMWEGIDPDNPELDKWRFQVMSKDPELMGNLRQAMGFRTPS